MKYLIAGLGNIGAEYQSTRHNIGFDVLDALAGASNSFFSSGRLADVAEVKHRGKKLILIKPTTYMNLSGKAINYWLQQEKIPVENLLVVLDDLALPFGTIRIRPNGSDAGHNGLKNINEILGHNRYARLRFGIGNNFPKGQQVDFVLGTWSDEEQAALKPRINQSIHAILSFVSQGLGPTMSQFNNK
ncbi:MAG TPA: aminoacyl-tRNA hydrolase [Luteibaculaceae bacterium]|nr:aminoacyl-tRNA hydrolase [Luteibaculaceae bacterium]